MKPTISVDFDGTICEHKFPSIGPLKPGAKEALQKLSKKYTIVISSCRGSKLFNRRFKDNPYIEEMREFLVKNGIPFDRIDMGDEGKVVAIHYIDDRAIDFKNNWDDIVKELL